MITKPRLFFTQIQLNKMTNSCKKKVLKYRIYIASNCRIWFTADIWNYKGSCSAKLLSECDYKKLTNLRKYIWVATLFTFCYDCTKMF